MDTGILHTIFSTQVKSLTSLEFLFRVVMQEEPLFKYGNNQLLLFQFDIFGETQS